MAALQRELRQSLERTVVSAREAGEAAARAAITNFAINEEKPFTRMSEEERRLRRALRAKSRQLGGDEALVAEIAYQHWHRMLFARFLAENGLLIYPGSSVAVSLQEVAELAKEEKEPDPWNVAARFAAAMLPAIFRRNDPVLEIRFAPEGRQRLEALLSSLPKEIFTADDSLGWVYQFWQSQKWKDVNKAGGKIGAGELPAVTQLFTEDYMVRFLLENSLGAWWAARHPESDLVKRFKYLRYAEDGTPAAGTFANWPKTAAEIAVMDPCCGSGHFLTVAFEMLTEMRMVEQSLSVGAAGDAVIAENLFGLELDPRCTQIAAFALALSAWKQAGYRQLPGPNIACSGIGVASQLADWRKLANGDRRLERALDTLHDQFRNAPELGSLIDPRRATDQGHLFSVDHDTVVPLLEKLLSSERDPETEVAGWAAAGIARAARLLARKYTLISTNVPYLNWQKQSPVLKEFCSTQFPDAKSDLATSFLERCRRLAEPGCTWALVLPQNWLFLSGFRQLRERLLATQEWNLLAKLGPGAFEAISGHVVNTCLLVATNSSVQVEDSFLCLDVAGHSRAAAKAAALRDTPPLVLHQRAQLNNPDARIVLSEAEKHPLLLNFADSYEGIGAGDLVRFSRRFWEIRQVGGDWEYLRSTTERNGVSTGLHSILFWQHGQGELFALAMALQERLKNTWRRGSQAWGKDGVAVNRMGDLSVDQYRGEIFDSNIAAIIPKRGELLPAIWCFLASQEFKEAVRALDQSIKITNVTFLKVSFDVQRWQAVAGERYPRGLPAPCSNDPTQWLFKGDPTETTDPLHVAVARLLGYRWPGQEADAIDEFADNDGVVCIPAVAGEAPGSERLRALLEHAWRGRFSPDTLKDLLARAGAPGKDLEVWLRDDFFAAHAKLFHNRPFIWHIWDGRRDGFSALVNYHVLDYKLLNRITYTILGAWIELQRDQVEREVLGAENRLAAAQELQRKLELVAQGEPPYDIYVRWKSLADQPIGWEPDLNDGVRINIRPFVEAGILRARLAINWNKDRGNNPDDSERLNNLYIARAMKEAARRDGGRMGHH